MWSPLGARGAISAEARVTEISIGATVVRCGCGDPDSHNGTRGPAQLCPRPMRLERRGTIGYWHRNPFRRLLFRLRRS